MSENWEEWGAMMVGLRKGVGGVLGGGSLVAFVALVVTLIKGRCWTC